MWDPPGPGIEPMSPTLQGRFLTSGPPEKPYFFEVFFFFNILSFMNCLHVLEINPFSVALVANIFSHSEGCLFIVFMVAFAVQKLLSFIKSHLFIFVLIFITLRDRSKQILL